MIAIWAWIKLFLEPLGKFLSSLDFKVYLVAGYIVALFSSILVAHHVGFVKAETLAKAEYAQKEIALNNKAQLKYNALKDAATKEMVKIILRNNSIVSELIIDRKKSDEEYQNVLRDSRSGALRLRREFKCPSSNRLSASGENTAAAGSDDSDTIQLSRNAQEFFIREANRADQVVNQLTACQKLLH